MDIPKSQLSISHLKMICTIDKYETVKEAAESLFITQPALTNRLREAERRLKTKLFMRRGRTLNITNAGRRLLNSASKILEELARAEYDIARMSDGVNQVVRIGIPHYASVKWLPNVMSYFQKECADIELEITAEATKQPLYGLYNNNVDIVMMSSPFKKLDIDREIYDSIFLLEDELLACVSTKHSKANETYLEAGDFADETYITNSTIPEKDREYELFFKPENTLPRKVLQVGFNEAIIELINANLGMTIFSRQQIAPYRKNNAIQTIKLGKFGLSIYWHLVYLKQEQIERPVNLLSSLIQSYAKEQDVNVD